MAGDPNHLEKMGRELKCPICLSLLNSAASLNCNHVFCNSCIVKSLKSDSNCPVCKVPYRRREIRPAPRMDNLVGIYKSMEISSGVNIFLTQNVPSAKLSENQDSFREEGSRENSVHVKPSFPTKKRVQVPHTQSEGGVGETVRLSENSSRILKSDTGERGGPVLSPFFWLRDEENEEKLSQLSAKSPFHDVPFPDVPSFSDIKDSDDENSTRLTPDREELGKSSNLADKFDSEMFEWTQRACSPELCASPLKRQDADIDVIKEKDLKDAANDNKRSQRVLARNVKFMNTKQDDAHDISPPGTCNPIQVSRSKPKKRGRKARKTVGTTCPVKNANLALEMNTDTDEIAPGMSKARKRNKKVQLSDIVTKPRPEIVCAGDIFEIPDGYDKSLVAESPAPIVKKKRRNEDNTSLKSGKHSKKVHAKNLSQHPVRLEKVQVSTVNESGEASNEDTIAQLSALLVPLANKDEASDFEGKSGKLTGQSKDGSRGKRKSTMSFKSSSKDIADNIQPDYVDNLHSNEVQTTENIQNNMDTERLADPLIVKKHPSQTNDAVLQRCENDLGKIHCAFCLSSEESEASGEMVHYYNGRPVAADYNGGSKIVHSHRNCAEWAPNVYFEGDVAINLEAELVRSRRIKCSCCGVKGAALGCYEKSCRKSFHVPCAKLMPQCRWDMANFVMLCPLHPSYKFPSECSESQAMKSKCNTKKQSCVQHAKVAAKPDLGTSPNWSSSGSSKKCVLCCSALTNSEREIVSQFERISGITVSKKWELNVTNVIASTDENGACKRTLKVLMGILDGKWILSIKWIQACTEAMKLVDEEPFEIIFDTHGIRDGPQLGRLRVQNKLPKLFDGFKFYFMGEFVASYKGYLHDLITAAGGTILYRKPVLGYQKKLSSGSSTCQTFIIYSLELPDQRGPANTDAIVDRRLRDAETVANSSGAKVVSNSWVLNSIAACKLQSLTE